MTSADTTFIPTTEEIIQTTRLWLEEAVIGMNLCPFAKAVYNKQQIRFIVSNAKTPEALLEQLVEELLFLQKSDPEALDTTLLIHPYVLQDFWLFNDFINVADDALVDLDLEGELQIAHFHPDYQFADADTDDISNYTNRAPYPILHLLRESSIENALNSFKNPERIYENNIAALQRLGLEKWQQLPFYVSRKQQAIPKS